MVLCVLAVEEQWTEGIALADSGRKRNMLNREFAVVCRNLLSSRYSEDAVGLVWFLCCFFFLYIRNMWVKKLGYQLLFSSAENRENSEL